MTHVLFGWNRIFMVRDLTASENDGDESSPIRIEAVPFSEFEGLIESGKLRDSSVIAALYLAKRFLEGDGLQGNNR